MTSSQPIIILPGLDGTDKMLGEFCRLCSQTGPAKVLTLPVDISLDYPALANYFSSEICGRGNYHIIAESFSGPIGILLASKFPERVTRLTLVASFAQAPVSKLSGWLPWSLLFRVPLPAFIAKRYLVGQAASLTPVLRSAIRQNSVAVLCHRLRLIREIDVSTELAKLKCQVAYLLATNDRLIPRRCLDEILRIKPDTTIHELAGPHLILETHSETAWRMIFEKA